MPRGADEWLPLRPATLLLRLGLTDALSGQNKTCPRNIITRVFKSACIVHLGQKDLSTCAQWSTGDYLLGPAALLLRLGLPDVISGRRRAVHDGRLPA